MWKIFTPFLPLHESTTPFSTVAQSILVHTKGEEKDSSIHKATTVKTESQED
jgi:hypothetical protein